MSEIEKMYIRCKIKKQQTCSRSDTCYNGSLNECEGCNAYKYPEFTAEKQLELLCFLINFGVKIIMQKCDIPIKTENIANNLAGITNEIWQDLTEWEKSEIRRILE